MILGGWEKPLSPGCSVQEAATHWIQGILAKCGAIHALVPTPLCLWNFGPLKMHSGLIAVPPDVVLRARQPDRVVHRNQDISIIMTRSEGPRHILVVWNIKYYHLCQFQAWQSCVRELHPNPKIFKHKDRACQKLVGGILENVCYTSKRKKHTFSNVFP